MLQNSVAVSRFYLSSNIGHIYSPPQLRANLKSDRHLLSLDPAAMVHRRLSVVFPHYQAKTANPFNSYLLRPHRTSCASPCPAGILLGVVYRLLAGRPTDSPGKTSDSRCALAHTTAPHRDELVINIIVIIDWMRPLRRRSHNDKWKCDSSSSSASVKR